MESSSTKLCDRNGSSVLLSSNSPTPMFGRCYCCCYCCCWKEGLLLLFREAAPPATVVERVVVVVVVALMGLLRWLSKLLKHNVPLGSSAAGMVARMLLLSASLTEREVPPIAPCAEGGRDSRRTRSSPSGSGDAVRCCSTRISSSRMRSAARLASLVATASYVFARSSYLRRSSLRCWSVMRLA